MFRIKYLRNSRIVLVPTIEIHHCGREVDSFWRDFINKRMHYTYHYVFKAAFKFLKYSIYVKYTSSYKQSSKELDKHE